MHSYICNNGTLWEGLVQTKVYKPLCACLVLVSTNFDNVGYVLFPSVVSTCVRV